MRAVTGHWAGSEHVIEHRRLASVTAAADCLCMRLAADQFQLLFDTPLPQLLSHNLTRRVVEKMELFRGAPLTAVT